MHIGALACLGRLQGKKCSENCQSTLTLMSYEQIFDRSNLERSSLLSMA